MPAPEHEAAKREPLAPTSRRTFLGLAAAAGGVGLTAPSVTGDSGSEESVTVVASRAHADAVRSAADRLQERQSSASISLDVAETGRGIELFTTGEVDAIASGRPLLPDERARASEHGVDGELAELPVEAATLTRQGSAWVDPLRPSGIAEAWSTDGSVSTWAELSTDGTASSNASSLAADSTISIDGHDAALVRGVRETQYASGHGGVGYYEPDRAWLATDDVPDAENAAETPIVRLAYLGVDRTSLRSPVVDDLREAVEAVSAARVGDVDVFEDPYGVTAT